MSFLLGRDLGRVGGDRKLISLVPCKPCFRMRAILTQSEARLVLLPLLLSTATVNCYCYKEACSHRTICVRPTEVLSFHFQMKKMKLSSPTKATQSTRWKGRIETQDLMATKSHTLKLCITKPCL